MNCLNLDTINKLDNELKDIYYNNLNKKKHYNSRRENKINLILSLYEFNDFIIYYIIIIWILLVVIILIINNYYIF